MKIFVIHSGKDQQEIEKRIEKLNELIKGINEKDMISNKKSKLKDRTYDFVVIDNILFWKNAAELAIKKSDIVLYYVGTNCSENIEWEIEIALKYKKPIYTVMLNKTNKIQTDLLQEKYCGEYWDKAEESNLAEIFSRYPEEFETFNTAEDNDTLFKQYEMFVSTSENLVERRQKVSEFYITVNSAILGAFGLLDAIKVSRLIFCLLGIVFLIVGISLCNSWIRILKSYGVLNSSKMKIIGLIEQRLPASLYEAEWNAQCQKTKEANIKYISFTDSEIKIPKIFRLIYTFLAVILGVYIVFLLKR